METLNVPFKGFKERMWGLGLQFELAVILLSQPEDLYQVVHLLPISLHIQSVINDGSYFPSAQMLDSMPEKCVLQMSHELQILHESVAIMCFCLRCVFGDLWFRVYCSNFAIFVSSGICDLLVVVVDRIG